MIIEVDCIPRFEKRDLSEQRKNVYKDLEYAVAHGCSMFELVDSSYDYESLPGSVGFAFTEYFKTNYFDRIWSECVTELENHFNDGYNFRLTSTTVGRLSKQFYKCHTAYDPDLGHKRIFIEIDFDEAKIRKVIEEYANFEKERHIQHIKRKRALG